MFIYPDLLIEEIKKGWKEQIFPWVTIPDLPKDKWLKQLIDVAYHASFLTEELRQIGFRLLFCSKGELKSKYRASDNTLILEPIEFIVPRQFSVSEILRLSPATDFTSMLICVGPHDDNKLKIWALLDAGSSWWEVVHGESKSGHPPPNFLTISSTEPGNITISRYGHILINLRQGELFRPTGSVFDQGPVSDCFAEAKKQFYVYICNRLGVKHYDPIYEYDDDESCDDVDVVDINSVDLHNHRPFKDFDDYLVRVLFQIREKRHGGTLIILPNYVNYNDPRLTDRAKIKYPTNYDRAWDLISDLAVIHREYIDLLEKKDKLTTDEFYKSYEKLLSNNDEAADRLSDSVRFIASLSGVDGAVVLTSQYRLLGFGAEVIAVSQSLDTIKVSTDSSGETGKYIQIESFGTRHRSAFRFCSSYEEALAFVVSQDGGVKAIKRVGPDLVIWPDINLGKIGI